MDLDGIDLTERLKASTAPVGYDRMIQEKGCIDSQKAGITNNIDKLRRIQQRYNIIGKLMATKRLLDDNDKTNSRGLLYIAAQAELYTAIGMLMDMKE